MTEKNIEILNAILHEISTKRNFPLSQSKWTSFGTDCWVMACHDPLFTYTVGQYSLKSTLKIPGHPSNLSWLLTFQTSPPPTVKAAPNGSKDQAQNHNRHYIRKKGSFVFLLFITQVSAQKDDLNMYRSVRNRFAVEIDVKTFTKPSTIKLSPSIQHWN